MTPIIPVYFSVHYSTDGIAGSVNIRGNNSPDVTVTVEHISGDGPTEYEFLGNEASGTIQVHDGETIKIFVRHGAPIAIAYALLEVDVALAERLPALLNPRLVRSMLLQQDLADGAQTAPLSPPLANAAILEANGLAEALAQPADPTIYAEIGRAHEVIGQLPQPTNFTHDLDLEFVRMLERAGARVVTVEAEEVAQ